MIKSVSPKFGKGEILSFNYKVAVKNRVNATPKSSKVKNGVIQIRIPVHRIGAGAITVAQKITAIKNTQTKRS